jgi:hypothetical protein
MPRQLLVETQEAQVSTDRRGNAFIEGIYLSSQPNFNRRLYSPDCLARAVEEIQPQIRAGRMVGCLGHEQSMNVSPEKVSHVVQAMKQTSDGSWYGRSKVLETDSGCLMRKLIDGGVGMGISSRGAGDTKFNPRTQLHEVQHFKIISLDSVVHPSTDKHVKVVLDSIIYETAAQDSVAGHSLKDYQQRHITHDDVRQIVASIGKPELLAAFDKHSINFDEGPGSVLNPHMTETVPAHLEDLRFDLIRRLIAVNQQIASQNQGMVVPAKSSDLLGQYAKVIRATNDPIRKSSLKQECVGSIRAMNTMEAAGRLLSRVGSDMRGADSHSRDILESIQRGGIVQPQKQQLREPKPEDHDPYHLHPHFLTGRSAFQSSKPLSTNPFHFDTVSGQSWAAGHQFENRLHQFKMNSGNSGSASIYRATTRRI